MWVPNPILIKEFLYLCHFSLIQRFPQSWQVFSVQYLSSDLHQLPVSALCITITCSWEHKTSCIYFIWCDISAFASFSFAILYPIVSSILMITKVNRVMVQVFKTCCVLVTNKSVSKCRSVLWFLWNSCTSSEWVVDRVSIESFWLPECIYESFFTYILVIIAKSLVKSLSIVQKALICTRNSLEITPKLLSWLTL